MGGAFVVSFGWGARAIAGPIPQEGVTGTCGTHLTWTLTPDSTLTISGSGAMENYTSTTMPWKDYLTAIKSLILQEGLTTIGNYAFSGCSSLSGSLSFPEGLTYIGKNAFDGCKGLTGSLSFPAGITFIGNSAFRYTGFTSVSFPEGFTHIRGTTFYECKSLTSLSFPQSLDSIGESAFSGCTGLTGSLIFPESLKFIGSNAFSNCRGLTGPLSFPAGITSILYSTFSSCSGLSSVSFLDGLTYIGNNAFQDCSGLTGSLILPNSLTYLGGSAFQNCRGLTGSLRFPEGLKSIAKTAFYGCTGLTSLSFSDSLTTIGELAFKNCSGLNSVSFPDSLTTIAKTAFDNCSSLSSLSFPQRLDSIGYNAFKACSGLQFIISNRTKPVARVDTAAFEGVAVEGIPLYVPSEALSAYQTHNVWKKFNLKGGTLKTHTITVSANNPNYGYVKGGGEFLLDSSATLEAVAYPGYFFKKWNDENTINPRTITVTQDSSFTAVFEMGTSGKCGKNLTWVLRNDSLIISGSGAMYDYTCNEVPWNRKMKTIVFPDGLTRIGNSAFSNCKDLSSLSFPNSLTSLGDSAFYGCNGLKGSLSFPAGLTAIGNCAFNGCNGLTGSLSFPAGLTSIGNYAFYRCSGLSSFSFSEGLTSIGNYAFFGCNSLTSLGLPQSLDSIGEYAFYQCTGLTGSLILPNNLTYIGRYAFYYCAGLTGSLSVPAGITSICNATFFGCSGLSSVSFPEGLTTIGSSAFYSCSGLTSVSFPERLTTIAETAFADCSGLTSLSFPQSLDSIGMKAFKKCSGLQFIISDRHEPVAKVDTTAFEGVAVGDIPLYVPSAAIATYQAHNVWKKFDIKGLYTVTVAASPVEGGKVSGGGIYREDSPATLTAEATEGYKFVKWSDDTLANPRIITVLKDTTFTAYFAIDTFTVTAVANNAEWGTVTGSGDYAYGSTDTLTATAKPGYKFVKWSDDTLTNPRVITVLRDTAFTAVFADTSTPAVTYYTLTVKVNNEDWGQATGGGEFKKDTTVKIVARSFASYKFVKWQEDNDTNAVRSIKVVSDSTFTAVFAEETAPEPEDTLYVITVKVNNEDWGMATGGGEFKKDTTVKIEARSFAGYKFVKWQEDNDTNAVRSIKVVANATYTAVFAEVEGPGVDNAKTNSLTATRLYPNPNNGRFTVDVPETALMEVYNAAGVRVMSAELSAGKREVSLPAAGIYFIKLTAGDRSDCANSTNRTNRSERTTVKRVVVR